MQQSNFWDDQEKAAKISQQAADLKEEIDQWENLKKSVNDLAVLAKDTSDQELIKEIKQEYKKLQKKYYDLEFLLLFSSKFDAKNAILAIHAGTGGVDAQDWTEMLLRMYLRFCERKDFRVEILDKQAGKEAGIKSVTLEIKGKMAYGLLKSEAGTHRLVRISPFDAEAMRHTSFALVEVMPDLGADSSIKIKDDDLRIDFFRSSGPGGQSVNTTDSAVRIVHLPTKISVSCQSERSQHQNKERAMQILQSKLHTLEQQKQAQTKQALRGEFHEAKWSNQIRSYVLQPYKLVKDHRTGYKTNNVEAVLDGKLQGFIEEYLKKR